MRRSGRQSDSSELLEQLHHVADEKGIPRDALVSSIEGALVSAYKRAFGGTSAVRVTVDFETSQFRVYAGKRVVQEAMNPNTEVSWREARQDNPEVNLGDTIEREVTPSGFGRIAAQTAKQVLTQKLREAERVQVVSEYQGKSGQMYRGQVQRLERGNVIMLIGKAEAILPKREQVPDEIYRFGDSIYVYVMEVREYNRGPSITVSRTHPGLVRQLFMLEVPEIADGIVELKAVAREPGQRTKIAVAATNPDVDPVGACVGPRGTRVSNVVAELGNEKVDIVRWNADPAMYISNALSPAVISKVLLQPDSQVEGTAGTATVLVAEDQQSLAIGRQGQNVRLAAKLTAWRIDIRTEKQYAEEQARRTLVVERGDTPPAAVAGGNGEETTSEAATSVEPASVSGNEAASEAEGTASAVAATTAEPEPGTVETTTADAGSAHSTPDDPTSDVVAADEDAAPATESATEEA